LVTWPTSITATPRRLAKVVSSCAVARTWLTEPGALSTVSSHMVWIESMMTRSGASASSVVRMSRRLVSAASFTALNRSGRGGGAHPDLRRGLLARDVDRP
jgi:hypothetical protein